METDIMKKVFKQEDSEPVRLPSSGSMQWLLAKNGHLSLYILKSKPGIEFTAICIPDEELIYVLQGIIEYEDGRVVGANEAVFNLPNTVCRGRYVGTEAIQLLILRVRPRVGASPLSPNLMKKVIKLEDIESFRRPTSGSWQRVVSLTPNASVCYLENHPVKELPDLGHPEEEIVYVLQGRVEYENGRVVRTGEAICNLPDRPHFARYTGTEPIRSIEIKSPPDRRYFSHPHSDRRGS